MLVVGSNNSSNTLRLAEIAKANGTVAHLLDDVSKLNPTWLEGVDSVLITAGASAPEHLVVEIIEELTEHYDGVLDQETTVNEGMTFSMPTSLTSFLKTRDITVEGTSQ